MSSVLDKNVPVSQPVYCRDEGSGQVDYDTAMYSWMAVRASGPNVLKDTTLCGDSLMLGYQNTNQKEGQEPQENQLVPPSRIISNKLLWTTNPVTFDNANMPAALQTPEYNLTVNNSYNPAQVPGCLLYMAYQNSPGPISAFFPDPLNPPNQIPIYGDTFLEIDGVWGGSVILALNNDYGAFVYSNANPIIIQANINKYGQISSYGLSKITMTKGKVDTLVTKQMPVNAILWTAQLAIGGAGGVYNSAQCNPLYNPFVGSIYIPINGLAIYSPTTALDDSVDAKGFYCNLNFTLDCVVNDSAPTNPDAGNSPAWP